MDLETTLLQKIRKHFPVRSVLALSGCLCLLGSFWATCQLTRAATSDYSVTDTEIMLDGTNPGTATVSVIVSELRYFTAIQADWSLNEIDSNVDGGPYLTLSSMTRGSSFELPYNPSNGRGVWLSESPTTRLPVAAYNPVFSATYTVDKDTPAGTYTVSISNGLLNYEDTNTFREIEDETIAFLAEITVTRSLPDPDPGTTDPDPGTTDPDPGTTDPDPTEQTFTLTLNPNGGSLNSASATASCTTTTASCDLNLPSTTASRIGYDFLGWADSASATSAQYQPFSIISLSFNKTIYAVWKESAGSDPDPGTTDPDPGTTDPDPGTTDPDPGSGTTNPDPTPSTPTPDDSTQTPGETTNPETNIPSSLPKTSSGTPTTPNTGLISGSSSEAKSGALVLLIVSSISSLVFFSAFFTQCKKRKSVRSFSKEN